jgi:hypothetical protein
MSAVPLRFVTSRSGTPGCRAACRHQIPRSEALLCIGADRFYASALIAANLNPKVIQARLGHATIAETMDTYGHLFSDSDDLGRGAVDDALAGALAEQERNKTA